MLDLYMAAAVVWAASVVTFLVARRWATGRSKASTGLMALAVVGAGCVFVAWVRDSTILARILPFSGLVVLTSGFPLFCGAVAGLASQQSDVSVVSRVWPVAALSALGIYATIYPVLGSPPQCADQWDGPVCLQSSQHSCSAACAATVLRHCGIQSSEAEMAKLCLTRSGTTWQGLFRGLSLKTAGTQWRVEVSEPPLQQLRKPDMVPVILTVGIPADEPVAPVYSESYGWPPGQLHSVVLLGFQTDGKPIIADPDIGQEVWAAEDLQVLYRGTATRLVLR